MHIPLKVSNTMKGSRKLEGRKIRIPLDLREFYGYEVNEFLNLKSRAGRIITLQVAPAYLKDAEEDPTLAYVTEEVFSALKVDGLEIYNQEVDLVDGITLGCDPEFFLVDNQGRIVWGSHFFRKWGDVGYDGPMVEVRPFPSTSEVTVADNIMSLINKARHTMNLRTNVLSFNTLLNGADIRMLAASTYRGESAGFHLHYGLPKPLLGVHKFNRKQLSSQIVKVLDFYVGIPSIILEGSEDSSRRTFVNSTYGKPGNFVLDNRTLEYRVPGGYLLRHPTLTMGLMALGAVVVEDAVSRIRRCTDNYERLEEILSDGDLKTIYPNIPNASDIYRTIVSISTASAEERMPVIIEDVQKMVGYGRRHDLIEKFFRCVVHKEKFSNDIEQNWRNFYNEKQQGQMAVFCA